MINLLPPDYKNHIIYARRNGHLKSWIFLLIVALIGSLAIVGGGYIYLDQSIKSQVKTTETARDELKNNDIDGTRKKLNEVSTNTNLILEVLSNEILFSKLIRQMGASLPANTALDEIKIDSLDGSVSLSAVAKDINSATQLQVNLADPNNKIFQNADIESISCDEEAKGPYPCKVQLKALFADNNPYVYINPASKKDSK